MDRVFQHYEGEVTEFKGLRFSRIRSFVDISDDDIILLWFKVDSEDLWYRVFIDGCYCGIDKYLLDNSEEDLDEDIRVDDYSEIFREQKVLHAEVINEITDLDIITLIISFEERTLILKCLWDDGFCELIIE